jgi:putative redox protein
MTTKVPVVMNAKLEWQGDAGSGLRFEARTGSVSFPLDSGPDVASPSPMQAVLAAAAACSGMDVVAILRKMRQPVTGYEIAAAGERAAGHPRVFTKIELVHRLRGRDLKPASVEEAIRLSETKYCPVQAMLRPGVEITSRYEIVPE